MWILQVVFPSGTSSIPASKIRSQAASFSDRQLATGMVYQPWRWRYVGAENARAIRASGLSLEEFLALYQQNQA